MKKLLRIFFIYYSILLFASCESAYDLTKKIDGDITIGGNELAFPVGTTEKILLSKLLNISDSKTLFESKNGDYYITMKEDIKPTAFSIPNITINETSIDTKPLIFFPQNRRSAKSTNTINFNSKEPLPFEIESSIPSEVISITSATFKKNEFGKFPTLTLHIKFSGFPKEISSITIPNITFDLPKVMIYEPDEEIIGNKLIASGEIDLTEGTGVYTKELHISGLNLTDNYTMTIDPNGNKTMHINQPLDMNGQLVINSNNPILSDISEIKGSKSIEFSGASIDIITAELDININPIEYSYITEFPDFMKDPNNYLDLLNSSVSIDIATNSTAAITAKTTIKSQKNNATDAEIKLDLLLTPANIGGDIVNSRYWISSNNEKAPASHTWVNKEIITLIKNVPQTINISLTPQITNRNNTVELDKNYFIKLNYELLIPLMLGEKLSINYAEDFKGLKKDISDYTNKLSELILDVETSNNVPLNLNLTPIALDTNGNIINGVEISVNGDIKSAEKDNSNKTTGTKEVKSNSKLVIKEITKGALKELDALRLNIKAKSNKLTEGTMLNKNQYLTLTMKAKIPGGITININE